MLSALAIFPVPKDESFDAYVEPLNELDCRLRALNTHNHRQPQYHKHPLTRATPTCTIAGPMMC